MPSSSVYKGSEELLYSSDPMQAAQLGMQAEGDTLAAEDLELCRRGWPQQMKYMSCFGADRKIPSLLRYDSTSQLYSP